MRSAAYGFGLRRDAVEAGPAGYSGCLVALGYAVLLGPGHPATVVVAVLGAVVAVVVAAALGALLEGRGLPALTAPFCLVATAATAATAAATVLTPALGAITAPFGGHAFTWPFVLTTMLFLAAVPVIPRLRRV
ncbi:urea transporter [Kitasatospora aureofaciens]|uniref:urea transporter n=1 Tax=Kitasatospora aureofaciens TaxID=1894 RepID=UPI0033BEC8C4